MEAKSIILYAGVALAVVAALYGIASTATTSDAPDPLGAIAIAIAALALILAGNRN